MGKTYIVTPEYIIGQQITPEDTNVLQTVKKISIIVAYMKNLHSKTRVYYR